MTLLSLCAVMLLPRQFHVSVVENSSDAEVGRARWLFPLYLVAINVFVIPIALAGLVTFPFGTAEPDMHIFHERMGRFDAALGYAQQSLKVAEALGDAASIALARSLLGVSLHLAGEHRDALTMAGRKVRRLTPTPKPTAVITAAAFRRSRPAPLLRSWCRSRSSSSCFT